jgi:hypothetical protein
MKRQGQPDETLDSIAPAAISNPTGPIQRRRRARWEAIALGTVVGGASAFALQPLLIPGETLSAAARLPAASVDAGLPQDAQLPERDAQPTGLTAVAGEVRWGESGRSPAFDRALALAAVERAADGIAQRCGLASPTRAGVMVTFAPAGAAVGVLTQPPIASDDARACVERWLERAEVPPFRGEPQRLQLTVSLR